MKPKYWFSAHLHVKFNNCMSLNENEQVEFLALDKPMAGKANGDHGRSYFDVQQASWNNGVMTSQSITSLGSQNGRNQEAAMKPEDEENKQNQNASRIKLYHNQEWINIVQQTESLMPLENK